MIDKKTLVQMHWNTIRYNVFTFENILTHFTCVITGRVNIMYQVLENQAILSQEYYYRDGAMAITTSIIRIFS